MAPVTRSVTLRIFLGDFVPLVENGQIRGLWTRALLAAGEERKEEDGKSEKGRETEVGKRKSLLSKGRKEHVILPASSARQAR